MKSEVTQCTIYHITHSSLSHDITVYNFRVVQGPLLFSLEKKQPALEQSFGTIEDQLTGKKGWTMAHSTGSKKEKIVVYPIS